MARSTVTQVCLIAASASQALQSWPRSCWYVPSPDGGLVISFAPSLTWGLVTALPGGDEGQGTIGSMPRPTKDGFQAPASHPLVRAAVWRWIRSETLSSLFSLILPAASWVDIVLTPARMSLLSRPSFCASSNLW